MDGDPHRMVPTDWVGCQTFSDGVYEAKRCVDKCVALALANPNYSPRIYVVARLSTSLESITYTHDQSRSKNSPLEIPRVGKDKPYLD